MNKFFLLWNADYVNIKKKEGATFYGVGFSYQKAENSPSAKIEIYSAVYAENNLAESKEITADEFNKKKAEMLKALKKLLK